MQLRSGAKTAPALQWHQEASRPRVVCEGAEQWQHQRVFDGGQPSTLGFKCGTTPAWQLLQRDIAPRLR